MERYRITRGGNYWEQQGPVWFITFNYAIKDDPQRWDPLCEIERKATEIFRALKRLASKSNIELEYCWVIGTKGERARTPYEYHVHGMVTWLPDAYHAPTETDTDRFRSARLEKWAKKRGLTVWIEKARSATAVAGYCVKNVRALDDWRLPRRFRRFKYSRNWYPWTPEVKREARMTAAGTIRSKLHAPKRLLAVVTEIK